MVAGGDLQPVATGDRNFVRYRAVARGLIARSGAALELQRAAGGSMRTKPDSDGNPHAASRYEGYYSRCSLNGMQAPQVR